MKRTRYIAAAAAAVLCSAGLAGSALADDPIVTDIYTADPAALVHDGRMYIYTGRDEASPSQNNFVSARSSPPRRARTWSEWTTQPWQDLEMPGEGRPSARPIVNTYGGTT